MFSSNANMLIRNTHDILKAFSKIKEMSYPLDF